ncbi:SatD family protein [Dietzia cinnamea]|uniref:SatD family protein n=1 Tax=Dietzia cinnamea TaxID=321318 RepID=UPI0021A6B0FF|nr:SatD family protein [Dietzia cinnamea]MCT2058237.1 SatD family protein [Dietzia cinnamea]MCT2121616.1 SatD family protein [Dietzia cinnamea]MCT2145670.1 SatD family protein [Dietzia cinnamea]MCT2305070.1 SatD family protein [Dietzia cinnamea]
MWHDHLMYVVTIDQRRSRTSADRVPALLNALNEIPVAAAFERTAGDEVQGLLDDPAAVRSALLIALREGDWHCGVGAGDVDDESYSSGTRAGRGDAYIAARSAVDAAKGLPGSVAIRVPDSPEVLDGPATAMAWAADCEAVWALVAPLVLGRTEAQWRVVDAVDRSPTQAAAADELGITPASVTGALRASRIRDERAAYPALDRLLAGAHAAATGESPTRGDRPATDSNGEDDR